MQWMRFGSLGLALVAAGCDSGGAGEDTRLPPNVAVQQQARLSSFEKCEDLESYIEQTAITDMRAQLGWQRDMVDKWNRGGIPVNAGDGGGAAPPEVGPPRTTAPERPAERRRVRTTTRAPTTRWRAWTRRTS